MRPVAGVVVSYMLICTSSRIAIKLLYPNVFVGKWLVPYLYGNQLCDIANASILMGRNTMATGVVCAYYM